MEKTPVKEQDATAVADQEKDAEAIWKEIDADEQENSGTEPEQQDHDEQPDGDGAEEAADEPKAEQQEQASKLVSDDPLDPRWNELPEWAREEYRKARNSERSHHGRYVSAQRQIDALRNQMQARQPGETQQQADDRLEKVKEKITAIREDYPEIADPLAEIMETLGGTVRELQAAEQGRQQAAQQQYAAYVEEQARTINSQHPDWLDVIQTNQAAFAEWLDDQPKRIRDAAQANWDQIVDAQGMAEVISGFKQHIGIGRTAPAHQPSPQQSKRTRQLAGSASPSRSSARPHASGIPSEGDPEAIWNAFEEMERRGALRRA